jgi:hypothetical protein
MQDILSRSSVNRKEWLEIDITKTKFYFKYKPGIVVKILHVYLMIQLSRF